MASAPRIAPGRFSELGPLNWVLWRALSLGAGADDAHLFSTLGRAGGVFRGWLTYSGTLLPGVPGGKLNGYESELVILRVAHLRGCDYETDHHVRRGRRAGITAEVLARINAGPNAEGWSERDRAIITAVDELVETKDLSDHTWAGLAAHYDERRMIEFCLLVTQYDGLATTIGTLRIERDF